MSKANDVELTSSASAAPAVDLSGLQPDVPVHLKATPNGNHYCNGYNSALHDVRALLAQHQTKAADPQQPFMYAVTGPDGAAHIDENCVSASADSTALYIEVNRLNDSPDAGYSIVPVYLAAPQQHAQARPVEGEWREAERIRDLPAVHEAIQGVADDPTGDHGAFIVREVMRALSGQRAQAALSDEVLWRVHGVLKGAGHTTLAHTVADAIAASQQPAAAQQDINDALDRADVEDAARFPATPAIQQEGAALDERAAFEAWAVTDSGGWLDLALRRNALGDEHTNIGDYTDDDVQSQWEAWQARAALAAPSPVQPAPDPHADDESAGDPIADPAEAYRQGRADGIEAAAQVGMLKATNGIEVSAAIRALNKQEPTA